MGIAEREREGGRWEGEWREGGREGGSKGEKGREEESGRGRLVKGPKETFWAIFPL